MTPEDWKKADEYVSAMAKNMSKAQGKPDSEAKPHPNWKSLSDCMKCGEFMTHGHQCEAVERVQPEPATRFMACKCTCHERLETTPCGPCCYPSTSVEPQVEPTKMSLELRGLLDECRGGVEGNYRRMKRALKGAKGILSRSALEGAIADTEKTLKRIAEYLGESYVQPIDYDPSADSVSHPPLVYRDCRHCGHNIVYSLSAGGWVHMPDETKQCFLGQDSPDAEPSVSHPPLVVERIAQLKRGALGRDKGMGEERVK